ncbi:MAG TPA: hypothetical protein VII72_08700 [Myxococcota bacterium]|jgi:hypothetical protein
MRAIGRGQPFLFFLDPAAGLDRVLRSDGSWATVRREEQGFHHSALPTQTHHDRFGHLAFASGHATRAGSLENGSARIETGFDATVIDEGGALARLPEDVEAGAVRLTALIHPGANQPVEWEEFATEQSVQGIWPAESGGEAAFRRIQARCRETLADPSKVVSGDVSLDSYQDRGMDEVFADLVEPERRRQRRLIVGAIERLLALLGRPCTD